MTRNARTLALILATMALAAGCSSGGGDGRDTAPPPITVAERPAAAAAPPAATPASSPAPSPVSTSQERDPEPLPPPAPASPRAPEVRETVSTTPPPDPMKLLEDEQARLEARRQKLAERQTEKARVEADIEVLEKRRLSIRNPLLPRPQLPPEEEEAWRGLTAPQREARVLAQIQDARKRLADLDAEIESLRRGL